VGDGQDGPDPAGPLSRPGPGSAHRPGTTAAPGARDPATGRTGRSARHLRRAPASPAAIRLLPTRPGAVATSFPAGSSPATASRADPQVDGLPVAGPPASQRAEAGRGLGRRKPAAQPGRRRVRRATRLRVNSRSDPAGARTARTGLAARWRAATHRARVAPKIEALVPSPRRTAPRTPSAKAGPAAARDETPRAGLAAGLGEGSTAGRVVRGAAGAGGARRDRVLAEVPGATSAGCPEEASGTGNQTRAAGHLAIARAPRVAVRPRNRAPAIRRGARVRGRN
jgi:hypothetical protein